MKKILFSVLVTALLYGDDASTAGTSLGNTVTGIIGSKDGANNRLAQPLTSTSQMTTIDGKTSFNAQIQCPASAKSVGITFLGAGGNDYRLLIQQDTNLDGTYDYTYDTATTGRTVSGVCSNGVVMCTPAGSWSNCATYEWSVTNNKVTLQNVPPTDSNLGSCFCSNQSCGVGSLVSQIYDNVAGGISSAIMRSNPLYIVSKSEWSPTDMTYYLYGQDKTNCTGLGSSSWDKYGEKNPTEYYNSQTPPNTSIADVALQQGGDPNSYYSMISNQSNVVYNQNGDTLGMPNNTQCVYTNALRAVTTTQQQCASPVSWNGGSWCQIAEASTGGQCLGGSTIVSIPQTSVTVKYGQSLYAMRDYSSSNCDDDNKHAVLSYSGDESGGYDEYCSASGQAKETPIVLNTAKRQENVTINSFFNQHIGSGCDAYDIHLYLSGTYQQETFSNTVSNNCPTASSCTLTDEQACDVTGNNCVYTVRNGIKTGNTPLPSCYAYSSALTSGNICTDGNTISIQTNTGTQVLYSGSNAWFYYKRTYNCGNSTVNLNASQMVTTSNSAYKDNTATSMTYVDANGTTQTINNMQALDTCPTPVCTVRTPQTDTSQFADGTNRSQTAGGTTVYQTNMKTCIKDSTGAMTCPLDTNDTMVEACSCSGNMTGFQQAITTLGVVSDAAKDMICSQN